MGGVYFLFCILQSNKAAKLKQSKLDARRKQWISQGLLNNNKFERWFFVCLFVLIFSFDVYVGFLIYIQFICLYICIFMYMWL